MSESYFQTIAFTKGKDLEQRYLRDVGRESSAIDIINSIFKEVASSRMDVSWLCDRYISNEFTLKDGQNFKNDRDRIRDSLFVFYKMRQTRKLKISSLFKLASIKELKDAIKPFYNKNEEMSFDHHDIARTARYILHEVFSINGYQDLTGTTVGYAVINTQYNKRAFVLEDLKRGKMYGLNCLELKAVTVDGKRENESSFKFILTNVISPSELEQLMPDNILGSENMFYQLLKYRYSSFSFQKNNLIRIEKFLQNIKSVYGHITSQNLYDSILRTDVFLKGYDFFGSLLYYMKENNITYEWNRLKPLMISIPDHQLKILEDNYGNLSAT